ncbi:MAG: GGDEF domain-containing protein [Phycisphaerae bacterium]|nr:GGDEF domain-containing protein [Phycisphaerae bacterium]
MDRVSDSMAAPTGGRVLLIGAIGKALLDAVHVDRYPCEVRTNILEGIDAAARGRFAAIGVVMAGTTHQLAPALKALREAANAKIFLLAQMHEEPTARRLVEAADEKLADTYLVCPTCWASLCSYMGIDRAVDDRGQKAQDGIAANPPSAMLSPRTPIRGRHPPSEVPLLELEQKIRHLEWLATTDDLTGLKNRRYIWEFARQILDRARQTKGRVTLLVFDIDNFKHYNDVYGHLTGDEILRQAAVLMRRCCRSHDVVGRIGGDEFAVIFWDDPGSQTGGTAAPGGVPSRFEGVPPSNRGQDARDTGGRATERERRAATAEHPSEAILLAKRFQKEFGNADLHLLGPEGRGVLTISGGLASFPRDGDTVQQLFERADLALRGAKGSGKNRIYLVGPSGSSESNAEL